MADEDEVQTGGGDDPEDLGMSAGTVNPGAEDLVVDEDDD